MKSALLLAAALACGTAMATDRLQAVAAAASAAQQACHGRIHHDTYDFESCLLELLRSAPRNSPRSLGIAYFGYVGAMNSDRMGMQGAEATAHEFLGRFRRAQRALGLHDTALCTTVPGNCQVRVARIHLMEREHRARQPVARDRSAEHQHQH